MMRLVSPVFMEVGAGPEGNKSPPGTPLSGASNGPSGLGIHPNLGMSDCYISKISLNRNCEPDLKDFYIYMLT